MGEIIKIVRKREEVEAMVLLVSVIEVQQIIHGLVSLCLSDIHAKKMHTSTEKVVLQKADLGFKKLKFDLEAVEVLVHNQLTSSIFGNS